MLVLTRHPDESIIIGDNIVIKVVEVRGCRVKIGVECPRGIPVRREEIMSKSAVWRAEDAAREGHE